MLPLVRHFLSLAIVVPGFAGAQIAHSDTTGPLDSGVRLTLLGRCADLTDNQRAFAAAISVASDEVLDQVLRPDDETSKKTLRLCVDQVDHAACTPQALEVIAEMFHGPAARMHIPYGWWEIGLGAAAGAIAWYFIDRRTAARTALTVTAFVSTILIVHHVRLANECLRRKEDLARSADMLGPPQNLKAAFEVDLAYFNQILVDNLSRPDSDGRTIAPGRIEKPTYDALLSEAMARVYVLNRMFGEPSASAIPR